MTGPRKLRDAADGGLGRALLLAAQRETYDERAVERTLAALALAASTATAATLGSAGVAKAATQVGVGGASAGGAAGAGAALGVAPVAMGAGSAAVAKGAVMLTVAKWFGATAIAGGAALGAAQFLGSSGPSAPVVVVSAGMSSGAEAAAQARPLTERVVDEAKPVQREPDAQNPDPLRVVPVAAVPAHTNPVASQSVSKVNDAQPAIAKHARGDAPAAEDVNGAVARSPRSTPPPVAAFNPSGVAANSANPAQGAVQGEQLAVERGPQQAAALTKGAQVQPAPAPAVTPQRSKRSALLTLEVQSIDAARERLKSGDAAGALQLLAQHRARFGSGALGPEALFLQMEAERTSGHSAAAKRTARQILERFPNGPSAAVARQVLAQ
jgi:hypothetical protein